MVVPTRVGVYRQAPSPLSEADRADAEWFLQEMLVIFPVLGIDAFEVASSETSAIQSGGPLLYLNERGAEATGREARYGFIVLKGSRARRTETNSIQKFLSDLRQQLRSRGVLADDGHHLVFTQDFRFPSPSTAAGVVVGGSANGRRAWKDEHGRSLRELQSLREEVGG